MPNHTTHGNWANDDRKAKHGLVRRYASAVKLDLLLTKELTQTACCLTPAYLIYIYSCICRI